MKKFYYQRSVSQEETPILQKLERRHTLQNAAADNAAVQWHEMELRDQRKHSYKKQAKKSASTSFKSFGSDPCSDSPASTMVITDSDLAGSWLYSTKKAAFVDKSSSAGPSQQIQSSPAVSERSPLPNADVESPGLDLKPIPLAPKERRKQTLWCYFAVMLIVFVCCFGILSSIGGIVYLELFASPRSVSVVLNQSTTEITTIETSITTANENNSNRSVLKEKDENLNVENFDVEVEDLSKFKSLFDNSSISQQDLNAVQNNETESTVTGIDDSKLAPSLKVADNSSESLEEEDPWTEDSEAEISKVTPREENRFISAPASVPKEKRKPLSKEMNGGPLKIQSVEESVVFSPVNSSKRSGKGIVLPSATIRTTNLPILTTVTPPMFQPISRARSVEQLEQMVLVMKQFQNRFALPSPRNKNFRSSTKIPPTPSGAETVTEKELYLDRLRQKFFDT